MIKKLRKKALEEVIGKPGPFSPAHRTTHPEEKTSPNQYYHTKEEKIDEMLGGTYHKRKTSKYKQTLGALEKRKWQKQGQQKMRGRYTEEEVEKLGSTDTGNKKGETIDVNPNIPTAKGETTKNTTIKERKEK